MTNKERIELIRKLTEEINEYMDRPDADDETVNIMFDELYKLINNDTEEQKEERQPDWMEIEIIKRVEDLKHENNCLIDEIIWTAETLHFRPTETISFNYFEDELRDLKYYIQNIETNINTINNLNSNLLKIRRGGV